MSTRHLVKIAGAREELSRAEKECVPPHFFFFFGFVWPTNRLARRRSLETSLYYAAPPSLRAKHFYQLRLVVHGL